MKIQLNGQSQELEASLTLSEILNRFQLQNPSIAVAVNAEIVPRSEWDSIRVRANDSVEVVHAVGGG